MAKTRAKETKIDSEREREEIGQGLGNEYNQNGLAERERERETEKPAASYTLPVYTTVHLNLNFKPTLP